jgi:Double zinc ribbon
VRCGQCGASLGEGDRFCGGCGAPSGGCPSCGEPVTPGDRFCRSCGSAQPDIRASGRVPDPGATPNLEPVAERRVCSVLFCDAVGFTPLSESRDPEAVRELLSEYFTAAAYGRPAEALRRARAVLTHADALGISHGELVWSWSLAVRAATEGAAEHAQHQMRA